MRADVALFAIAFCAFFAAVYAAHHWIARPAARRERSDRVEAQRAARIAEVNARLGRVPAAPDNQAGSRLDWHDDCELLWATPFDPQTGLDRLRHELRKQRREEGQ
ncbi:hypothetical protein [Streptomyces sp. NBC_01794]|uniref:hypothetical protein n=1 Tax=Streptomyces sp. NBC_01794 TaxID=2975942 RepID=UPI00308E55F6|nr:hypothetical protein OIE54_12215 [Streptomyces sp. NBC_01794]